MIKEIAEFIEDHTSFIVGTTLFVGHLPLKRADGSAVPVRVQLVLENTPASVEGQLPDYADKYIQVWNRAATFFEARDDAYEIYSFLHGASGWALPVLVSGGPAYYVCTIDALGQPAPIENPNEKGEFVFSTNYVWRIENP